MSRYSVCVWFALFGLIVTAGVLLYVREVHPTIVPKRFGVVEEGVLYRAGGLTPAAFERVVRAHGIKTIVDLGGFDRDPVMDQAAERTAQALGVQRLKFHLSGDGTGKPERYVQALLVISDPARQPVLVHCSAGSERTGGCVMLYRRIFQGTAFAQSLAEARGYGHDERDNPRLMSYLEEQGAAIERAVREGVVARQHDSALTSPTRTSRP